jgi:hypothetical protein
MKMISLRVEAYFLDNLDINALNFGYVGVELDTTELN